MSNIQSSYCNRVHYYFPLFARFLTHYETILRYATYETAMCLLSRSIVIDVPQSGPQEIKRIHKKRITETEYSVTIKEAFHRRDRSGPGKSWKTMKIKFKFRPGISRNFVFVCKIIEIQFCIHKEVQRFIHLFSNSNPTKSSERN